MSYGNDSFVIDLGLEIDDYEFSKIRNQINNLQVKKINLDLNTKQAESKLNSIRKQIKNLSNMKVNLNGIGDGINLDLKNVNANLDASKIMLDTSKVEKSLESLASTINEIKVALGSVDDQSGMKDLLTTINEVSKSLTKVTTQFEALSKKDFNLNLDVTLGGSNTQASKKAAFDYEVTNNILPELEKQAVKLEKEFGDVGKLLSSLSNQKFLTAIDKPNENVFNILDVAMDSKAKLENRINAYKQYINLMQDFAKYKGIDISNVTSGFSKSADTLVDDAHKILTGKDQIEDSFTELKNIFGGNNTFNIEEADFVNINNQLNEISKNIQELNNQIKNFDFSKLDFSKLNFTNLETQLKNVVDSLNKIDVAVQNLSSASSINNLITSFDKLSDTLQEVFSNLNLIQTYVNNAYKQSVGNFNSSVNNIRGDVSNEQKNLMAYALKNKYGFDDDSVRLATDDIDKMNLKVKEINTVLNKDNVVTITVKGLDDLGRAVQYVKEIRKDPINAKWQEPKTVKTSISQSFDQEIKQSKEVVDAYKRLLDITKQIGNSNVQLIKADPIKDAEKIETLRKQLKEYDDEYTELLNKFGESFNKSQKDGLDNAFKNVINKDELASSAVADSNAYKALKQEIKKTNTEFKKLYDVEKRIGSLKFEIGKLDSDKNTNEIKELTSQLNIFENEYKRLKIELQGELSPEQLSKLGDAFNNAENKLRVLEARLEDTKAYNKQQEETKETTEAYKRMLDITKQIGNSSVNFVKLDKESQAKEYQVLERQLEELNKEYDELFSKFALTIDKSQFESLNNENKKIANSVEVAKAKVEDLKNELASYIIANSDSSTGKFVKQYKEAETKLSKLSKVPKDLNDNAYLLSKTLDDLISQDTINDIDKLIAKYNEFQQLLAKVNNQADIYANDEKASVNFWKLESDKKSFTLKIDKWLKLNSAAAKDFGPDIEKIRKQIEKADKEKLTRLKKEFDEVKDKAILAGKATMSFTDRFKNQFARLTTYYSASMFISEAMMGLRAMYDNVLLVDSAMTELYRVTDLTESQYESLYDNMTKSAKEYGVALNDIITSTADWVKMGFDENEASRLAEITTMYQHISDLENDVAVENLVTAYKGFQDELLGLYDGDKAKAVEYIADVYNELGNNYAVTADGVGDAMTRAASALDLAGNTFQESSAMITGIAEVTQDYEKSGSALKILSLRLRGMKGQLEELGEETDENVENISKMQGQILNLTHGKVNIFDASGNFKSTYEIMQGIADIWYDLSSVEQADLLETIAGKHRANDISALISNWEQVEDAVISANKAEGSAAEENAKYLESLQGKLDELKASWQALSNTVVNSELLKTGVDFLTLLINLLDDLINTLGGVGSLSSIFTALAVFKGGKLIDDIGDLVKNFFELDNIAKLSSISLKDVAIGLKDFAKTSKGAVVGIGLVITIISTLINLYKNWEEEQSRLRQETLKTNNEILNSIDSFEQVYVKYSGKTRLTSKEESELKTAIDATTTALGDKADGIQGVINKNGDYIKSLEDVSKAEIEEAKRISDENLVAAGEELEKASGIFGRGIDISIGGMYSSGDEKEIQDIIMQNMSSEHIKRNTASRGMAFAYSIAPTNYEDADSIIEFYYDLINVQKKLYDSNSDFVDNNIYKEIGSQITELTPLVEEYAAQQYNSLKYEYEIKNGIPKTIEQYQELKKYILENIDASQDYKDVIAKIADTEWGQIFGSELDKYYADLEKANKLKQQYLSSKDFKESSWTESQQKVEEFNDWIDSLSPEDLSIVYSIMVDNSEESRQDMKAQLEELSEGGNVDLVLRPTVDTKELTEAGWEDAGEGSATVFTSTFANKAGELGKKDGIAMNFTPIIVDENGNHIGTLSPEELEQYALDVMSGVREDDLNLKIGATYTGSDAIEQAEADAIKIHELHEKFFLTPSLENWNIQDWMDALLNYEIPESSKYSFSDLIADEEFVAKIDAHTEKINKLKEASDKLKDGSFDIEGSDFIELVKAFPELADNADNLEEAIDEVIDESNLSMFEELTYYLDYMKTPADYNALLNLTDALTNAKAEMHNALDFTSFLDNINNVVDSFDNLVSAMSKLRNGTVLTKSELIDLVSEYPKLLTEANLFTDGSIEGQQRMLDNILQVYETEYNAHIDTKIAELKATNEILNLALDNEKAKATKILEISALEVEGKVLDRAELVEKLQEFNDLDGQNYVEYSNGTLAVNKEMLDNMLEQEHQHGELSAENVWKPQAVVIGESFAKGGSAALKSLNTLGTRVSTWVSGLKTKFKSLAKTIASALTGKEYDDGKGINQVNTDIKAVVEGVEFNGDEVTIDEKKLKDWASKQQDIIKKRIEEIQKTIGTNQIAIDNLEALKGLDLVSTYGGSGSGGSKGSDSSSKSEEDFDWIEVMIKRIQRALSNLGRTANSVYKTWDKRNDALRGQISKTNEEIDAQNKAYKKYMEKADAIGLSDSWKKKVQEGLIDIDTLDTSTDANKALAEKISKYQELYEKALACLDAVEELKESESDLYKQAFDNVVAQYEGMLSIIEHEKSMIDEYIAQSEAKGWVVSTKYYEALTKQEEDNIAKLQEEKQALLNSLQDGMANGGIEKYSEQWYDMVNQIDSVTLAIEQGETALLEYANAIREIEWQVFDMIREQVSWVTDEANFLIDLMSNEKLYDDRGQLTEYGLSTMGMHGMNYNVYMEQANAYAKEMLKIEKELAENPYDQNLINRKHELIELQQESIIAAEDEKEAIVDMVREGIELELDALDELINKYEEALDSQKDLYDYQKKVAEQTKEIASLEKQMSAYQNDDSEEVKAKIQKIKLELEEAKENLEETEYERYISDQKKLLEELYLEYETILNERLDNIDALIEDMIAEINANASTINETITEVSNAVGYTLSETMVETWNTSTTAITDVLTVYGDNINRSIISGTSIISTTLQSALSAISSNINSMMDSINSSVSTPPTSSAHSQQANTPTGSNKPSTNTTNTKPSGSTSSNKDTSNKNDTSSSNTITKGSTVSVPSSAKIYDYAGDTSGERQYYRNNPTYVVLNEKNGYVQVRHSSLSSGITGWFKKSDIKGYATGKQNFLSDEIAWTQEQGREFIIRPSDGAILTPIAKGDSVLNAGASNNIWQMANNPTDFIKDNLKLDVVNTPVNNGGHATYTQNLDNVVFNFPNVKSYSEMLNAMKADKNFERLIMSMTIDQIAGKSSLAKGKSIR